MSNFVSSWLRNRQAIRALARLSDRELADVGIGRGDIKTTVASASGWGKSDDELSLAMAPSWGHQQAQAARFALR